MTNNTQKKRFITFEGIEGAGKSTAVHYCSQLLAQQKIAHVVTREPGGTPIAESIRQVLLSEHKEAMHPDTELLLMFAGRSQHIARVIEPALAAQQWVLCDRFTDASFAYQGGGRGMSLQRIAQLAEWVHGDLQPDVTILLDVPVDMGLQRVERRGAKDRFEQEQVAFFNKVRDVYLQLAVKAPDRYRVVDASQSLEHVQVALKQIINEL